MSKSDEDKCGVNYRVCGPLTHKILLLNDLQDYVFCLERYGIYPLLPAVFNRVTRKPKHGINPEILFREVFFPFLFSVKDSSCVIYTRFRNRESKQADTFFFYRWFKSKPREVKEFVPSSHTRLSFAGRLPKIERRTFAVHPQGS